jgi:hypothetical protein
MKNRISRRHLHSQAKTNQKRMRRFFAIMIMPAFLTLLWVTINPIYWILAKDFDLFENNTASKNLAVIIPDHGEGMVFNDKDKSSNLFIEKAYWKNKVRLAKEDSIALSIDLIDSLIFIEMQGVVLRKCKIQKYDLNWSLKYFKQHPNFLSWLKTSFILQGDSASITKVPIKVIHAPESPIDAAKLLAKILPQEEPKVKFWLKFDRNLQFQFRQADSLDLLENRETNVYYSDILSGNKLTSLPTSMKEYFPSREYQIDIILSHEDAKAIYRALPRQAQLALRM